MYRSFQFAVSCCKLFMLASQWLPFRDSAAVLPYFISILTTFQKLLLIIRPSVGSSTTVCHLNIHTTKIGNIHVSVTRQILKIVKILLGGCNITQYDLGRRI